MLMMFVRWYGCLMVWVLIWLSCWVVVMRCWLCRVKYVMGGFWFVRFILLSLFVIFVWWCGCW